MHAKMWSSKTLLPLQISGHFTGNFVGRLWESLGVSDGKIMERCIAKTFSKWNNSQVCYVLSSSNLLFNSTSLSFSKIPSH